MVLEMRGSAEGGWCLKVGLAVADLARKDVNLDLIKVEGKVGCTFCMGF